MMRVVAFVLIGAGLLVAVISPLVVSIVNDQNRQAVAGRPTSAAPMSVTPGVVLGLVAFGLGVLVLVATAVRARRRRRWPAH